MLAEVGQFPPFFGRGSRLGAHAGLLITAGDRARRRQPRRPLRDRVGRQRVLAHDLPARRRSPPTGCGRRPARIVAIVLAAIGRDRDRARLLRGRHASQRSADVRRPSSRSPLLAVVLDLVWKRIRGRDRSPRRRSRLVGRSRTARLPDPPTARPARRGRTMLVLLTLAAGQFLMTLDSSVMNVSIATVAEDVGTTVTGHPGRDHRLHARDGRAHDHRRRRSGRSSAASARSRSAASSTAAARSPPRSRRTCRCSCSAGRSSRGSARR